jgi:hypothetical protein
VAGGQAGASLADLRRAIHALELKIAECSGAVNVLRTGKNLRVRGTFIADAKYEQLDVVMLNGSSFIARADNPGECPGEGMLRNRIISNAV